MSWYVNRDRGVTGPYTEAEVFKRIADGNINERALVRKDPATEWSPIETTIFETAFGEANPYRNPELTTPERSKHSPSSRPLLWLALGALCLVALWAIGRAGDAHRFGLVAGETFGRLVGGLVLAGILSALFRLIRPKPPG